MRGGSGPLVHYAGAMKSHAPAPRNVAAVLIATAAALVARAWLQIAMIDAGYESSHAGDLAYLAIPPVLLVLLFPVLLQDKAFLRQVFDISHVTAKMLLAAIAIGLILRLAWWAQLVAGISFGVYRDHEDNVGNGPEFVFDCPEPGILALGFLVMAMLVPLIEELTHRAYVLSALRRQPAPLAIVISATLFTIFHPPSNWLFVFVAGLVLGVQFWQTRSLWSSITTHATINGLIQFDWRCLHGSWNPAVERLPMVRTGTVAIVVLAICIVVIVVSLAKGHRGAVAPR